jgi:pimeloyl-ACP methyl ester carboxylesterase
MSSFVRVRPVTDHPAPVELPPAARVVHAYSADGTRIHAQVYGPEGAPAIVLAHGITQQIRAWAYQIQDLSSRYRVIAYDQRGHGQSGRVAESGYTIDALGQDLQAVLDATLADGEQAVLAGHSMGGISIMSWAAQYPDEVARRAAAVALVNTAPSEIAEHIAVVGLPRRTHAIARAVVRRQLISVIRSRARIPLRMLAFGDQADPVQMDALMDMVRAVPAQTFNSFVVRLTEMDLLPDLGALTAPTTVVGGTKDRLLPPVHCRHLEHALPDLEQVVMLPGAGHMGPWERRDAVSHLLDEAASRHLGGAGTAQAYA